MPYVIEVKEGEYLLSRHPKDPSMHTTKSLILAQWYTDSDYGDLDKAKVLYPNAVMTEIVKVEMDGKEVVCKALDAVFVKPILPRLAEFADTSLQDEEYALVVEACDAIEKIQKIALKMDEMDRMVHPGEILNILKYDRRPS